MQALPSLSTSLNMDKIKILLVEDEDVLAMIVKETLETRGFEILIAANGVQGWSYFNNKKPDLCIIDVMMPRKDGFSLVQDIRKVNELIPIIFLTAKTQTEDVLTGLEIGADDYMKKPFSMEELILRVKSLLRRNLHVQETVPAQSAETFIVGRYCFNYPNLELSEGDTVYRLSQREAELMKLLAENKNKLLDRRTALLKIWGDDSLFNARSMDVYITRLRKFLHSDPAVEIVNIRGHGFKLIERKA